MANADVRVWCETTAGQRIHGTTKEQPIQRFQEVEQAQLQPLPAEPYDMGVWKQVKLHRDCHIVFEGAYYSAPFRLIGQTLRVRGGVRHVRIYTQDYELIATHAIAFRLLSLQLRDDGPQHLISALPPVFSIHRSKQVQIEAADAPEPPLGEQLAKPLVEGGCTWKAKSILSGVSHAVSHKDVIVDADLDDVNAMLHDSRP